MYNDYNYNPYFNNRILEQQFMPQNNFGFQYKPEPIYDPINIPMHIPNKNMLDLNNEMRRLWIEHIVWTKFAVSAILSDAPDTKLIVQRLLQNPSDFEKLFAEYYGFNVAKRFNELLTEHLLIAAEIVKAAKKGDTASVDMLNTKWYKNADDIADFLSSINEYWDRRDVQRMMYKHLDLLKSNVMNMIENRYEESIKTFDQIQKQALQMADTYTEGIIKKFPNKFM